MALSSVLESSTVCKRNDRAKFDTCMKISHLMEFEAQKTMENRPKLKNASKAIFRARDSFPDLQLIALIRDPLIIACQ